jgi:hypothetical protein
MPAFMQKPKGMCVGPSCSGCSSANCYADGGMTETGHEKGINRGRNLQEKGVSYAGANARGQVFNHQQSSQENQSDAKEVHRKTLSEMQSMKKPNLYARGGKVKSEEEHGADREEDKLDWEREEEDEDTGLDREMMAEGGEAAYKSGYGSRDQDFQSGVHSQSGQSPAGQSNAGRLVRRNMPERAKALHRETIEEQKSMPKPKLMASGGQVNDDVPEAPSKNAAAMQAGATSSGAPSWEEAKNNIKESLGMAEGGEVEGDDELSDMMGQEHMDAMDSKDKKRIMQSIEAIVLSCMNKE